MELTEPGPKVLVLGDVHAHAVELTAVAARADDAVAPPVEVDVGDLESEEDDDGGDRDGAGEGGRSDVVVLSGVSTSA